MPKFLPHTVDAVVDGMEHPPDPSVDDQDLYSIQMQTDGDSRIMHLSFVQSPHEPGEPYSWEGIEGLPETEVGIMAQRFLKQFIDPDRLGAENWRLELLFSEEFQSPETLEEVSQQMEAVADSGPFTVLSYDDEDWASTASVRSLNRQMAPNRWSWR